MYSLNKNNCIFFIIGLHIVHLRTEKQVGRLVYVIHLSFFKFKQVKIHFSMDITMFNTNVDAIF